jgi:hypothetical protein
MDLGAPVVLHAFAWALLRARARALTPCTPAAMDLYPTLTVHGSNSPEFMLDLAAQVTVATPGAAYCGNRHTLAHAAQLLWELRWESAGSRWTPAEVAAGQAEIFHTRLSSSPRYSRLLVDGTVETEDYAGFPGHSTGTVRPGGPAQRSRWWTRPPRRFAITR